MTQPQKLINKTIIPNNFIATDITDNELCSL